MSNYRVTWRHEVEFKAENDEAARDFWESLNLDDLACEVHDNKNSTLSHDFVELTSFECVSDNYRKVPE